MNIRALALDLDGTLLGPDDTVSARNRAAVRAAADAGWHVILATARWYQLAERTAHDLSLVDPVIACSGAEVRRLRDGSDLLDVRLPRDFAAVVYTLCDQHDGLALVYEDHDVAMRTEIPPPLLTLPEVRRVDTLTADADPTPRAVLIFGDGLSGRVLDLARTWSDDVRCLVSMTASGLRALTLTSTSADKGLALEVACADIDVPVEAVVAMGDSETDIEMFRVAGASVAMGQALDPVKDAATWVCAAHGDDGVGRSIEDLLAGRPIEHA
jgi:hydroxymethylpyrimidine pyrophosphatase-like HAD family hydrolase